MIKPYTRNQLRMDDMELFLRHISGCSECREELAIYYTIFMGMECLNQDEDIRFDFTAELNRKLRQSEEKIQRAKGRKILRRILLVVFAVIWILFNSLLDEREEPKQSRFTLETYFFQDRESTTEQYIMEYMQNE